MYSHYSGKRQLAYLAAAMAAVFTAAVSAESPRVLSSVDVIGDPSAIYEIPGSAHFIDYEDIREYSYDDINRVLRRVPGVYLREEDGYGLFPNISLRGVDTSRSAKVSLMEDGILAAPAPYAAPSAYYSPTTGRMSGIEVLKGTSQVKYGPHTTGGAVNYLSTPIPFDERIYLRGQFGEDNEYRTHAIYGNTVDTGAGRFGYLLEGYIRNTDGFKTIDPAPGFTDTGDTGFHNIEPMIKLAWEPASGVYQRFEIKYGHTDKVADETYLGLSTADFRNDPYRRYSSSQFDEISTEQHRSYIRHFIAPTDNIDIATTAYYNKFRRNWYKLHTSSEGSLSSVLAGGGNLNCLRGMAACDLTVRANDRAYEAWGVQTQGTVRFESGSLDHELTAGLRYHEDEEDRFQRNDVYNQIASGAITGVTSGTQGGAGNRVDSAEAVALFIQDRIELGDWWITPGFRHEWIDFKREDRAAGTTATDSLTVMGGGIGAGYNFTSEWQAFGGVHFGFSPPSPGAAVNNNLEEETSTGYELGLRYTDNRGILAAEVVGFLTQFEDLIVVSNIGGTGTGNDENFGEVDSYGVELSGEFDLARANGWSFNNPYFLAYTYTNAEQQNDAQSTDAESIFSFGREGNKVPYIPENQLTVGSSLEFTRWGASITAIFIDETFTSANNVATETNGLGAPDARFGKTDSYTVVDLATHYKIRDGIKLFGGVHNVFEEEYIVSRQPHGPRPGAPRLWFVGLELEL